MTKLILIIVSYAFFLNSSHATCEDNLDPKKVGDDLQVEAYALPSFPGSEKLQHTLLAAIGIAEKNGVALETILVVGTIQTDSSVDMKNLTELLEATVNVIVDTPTRIMTFRGNLRGVKNAVEQIAEIRSVQIVNTSSSDILPF